jgi:hypothetical protein
MAEMVLDYSPLAPAISPVSPNDRRCTRAAGSPRGGSPLQPATGHVLMDEQPAACQTVA